MSKWNVISGGPSRVHLRPEHLLPDAATVTVNRAIDVVEQGIHVNFAALADAPTGCWKPMGLEKYLYMQPHIQLWVSLKEAPHKVKIKRDRKLRKGIPSPKFVEAAIKLLSPKVVKSFADLAEKWLYEPGETFEVMAPGPPLLWFWEKELPLQTGFRVLPQGVVMDVNDKNQARTAFTLICVLQRIWQFEPTHVRIISADMMGSWIAGMSEEECHAHEKEKVGDGVPLDRWRHERYALEQSIAKYRLKAEKPVEVEFLTPEPAVCVDGAVAV